MNFSAQQILPALFGGLVIGSVMGIFFLFWGRVAGVSGILFGVFAGAKGDRLWRVPFLAGLVAGGMYWWAGQTELFTLQFQPLYRVGLAGFLVGAGTQLANGCTSGHGVCGIGRGAIRSLVATAIFMACAILVVYLETRGGMP